MPRPPVKRSKLNHPNQAAKRVANNPLNSSPAARHRQLQEQLAHKEIGRVPNDSDDSDQLVTRSRNPRNRRGVPRREVYGSGGVAEGDHVAAHKSPARTRQYTSPIQAPKGLTQASDARKAAALPRTGLNAVNRLSTSKPAESLGAIAKPTNAEPSPLGPTSSMSSGVLTQQSPAAERSILGPLKIRKRQPSILQVIDASESPILDEYLDDFLPNDESTPLQSSRKRKLSPTPERSTPAPQPRATPQTTVLEPHAENTASPEPHLPPALSSPISRRRRQPLSELDSDTLAPPRSSSSAPSPVKVKKLSAPKTKPNIRKPKEQKSLSTAALQSLMPVRRERRPRRAQGATVTRKFDIPEDSSDARDDTLEDRKGDSGDEDSYILSPRASKGEKRKASARPRNDKKVPTAIRKQISAGSKPQREGRSSRPRKASTQSPSTSRAPAAAKKSPQQQHPAQGDRPVRVYSRPADKYRTKTSVGEEEEDDKENRPSASFGGSSERERGRGLDRGDALALRDELISLARDDDDIEIEVGRGEVSAKSGEGEDKQARLAKKFQEVDEWEMDFEDVTFDGEGSDPLAR